MLDSAARRYRAEAAPTVVLSDPWGTEIARREGFQGVDERLRLFRAMPAASTGDARPRQGGALTGCPQQVVQDYGVTDATGHYTLNGIDGSYELFILPATGSGLSGLTPTLSLSTTPATLNLPLAAGTSVTGRVVDATNPSIGIAGARLTFDGPAQETTLADGPGNFAVRLVPGSWKVEVHGAGHAFNKITGTVSSSSLSLGNVPLATGVKVSGVLTRLSDGTPFAGVEIDAFGPDLCCGKFDKTFSAGDGSFALFVPPNQTPTPPSPLSARASSTWCEPRTPARPARVFSAPIRAAHRSPAAAAPETEAPERRGACRRRRHRCRGRYSATIARRFSISLSQAVVPKNTKPVPGGPP